jgi:hypothetical protein
VRSSILVLLLAVFCAIPVVRAEEDEAQKELDEKERLEAEEEERKEQEKTGLAFQPITLKGTMVLNPIQDGETRNTAVGTFATLKGTFQLKFDERQVRREMMAQNGKVVTFTGKLRNGGKYFVVMRVEVPPKNAAPPARISPGGL